MHNMRPEASVRERYWRSGWIMVFIEKEGIDIILSGLVKITL